MKSGLAIFGISTLLAAASFGITNAASSNAVFTDVPGSHWAAKSVADLSSKGIVTKADGAKFNGNQYLTRYEAAVYLDRLVHYIEDGHKPLHVTVLPASYMPKIAAGPGQKAMLELAKYEFVDPKDPILTAPSSAPVTPDQMSHATSHVVIQLEDRRLPTPTADHDEQ